MSRRVVPLRLVLFLLLTSATLTTSCDDASGPPPSGDLWQVSTIVDAPESGEIRSLAFSGTRGFAAGGVWGARGWTPDWDPFLAVRVDGGDWVESTEIPPACGMLNAAGFTSSGEAILAGGSMYFHDAGCILDERGGWSRHVSDFHGWVLAVDSGIARVASAGPADPVMLKSEAPDSWVPESLPFPGESSRHGLLDLTVREGIFYACGYDDGGDQGSEPPDQVLFRNDATGWTRLETPRADGPGHEFRAVAANSAGAILLGGTVRDRSAGAVGRDRAFLLLRSPEGEWTEIVLPGSESLTRVNDILVTSRGDTYLACGSGNAYIIRIPARGASRLEFISPRGTVWCLAESPDGSVWAAGSVREATAESSSPAIWRRES